MIKVSACDWAVEGKAGPGGLSVRAGREGKSRRREGERTGEEEGAMMELNLWPREATRNKGLRAGDKLVWCWVCPV